MDKVLTGLTASPPATEGSSQQSTIESDPNGYCKTLSQLDLPSFLLFLFFSYFFSKKYKIKKKKLFLWIDDTTKSLSWNGMEWLVKCLFHLRSFNACLVWLDR